MRYIAEAEKCFMLIRAAHSCQQRSNPNGHRHIEEIKKLEERARRKNQHEEKQNKRDSRENENSIVFVWIEKGMGLEKCDDILTSF